MLEETGKRVTMMVASKEALLNEQHHINLQLLVCNANFHVAIFAARMCPVKRLNYKLINNDFFK